MSTTIRLRRDTSTSWSTNNPILALGEPGIEIDTHRIKIGDGVTHWNDLLYIIDYLLPPATTVQQGGVIIPAVATSGITNSNGTISLAVASTTQLGGVIVPAVATSGITNSNGTIGLAIASTTQLGGVQVDNSTITINNGIISAVQYSLPPAVTFTQITRSGNASATAWTTSGIGIKSSSSIFTDTSSTSTVPITAINAFSQHTLASTNTITVTDAATLYIAGGPIAGTNTTITNNDALYVAAGTTKLLGPVSITGSNVSTTISPSGTGNVNISPSGTGNVTISSSGTGIVSINSNSVGTIDNMTIGGTTQATGSFTKITTPQFVRSGSLSAPAWTTSGVAHQSVSGSTFTDTSSTGTVAISAINGFNTQTLASTNTITVTDAATIYIGGAPSAGTNTTITNRNSLYVASGISRFLGAVTINGSNVNTTISPTGTGTVTINPATLSSMDNVTIGANTAAGGAFTTLTTSTTISSTDNSTQAATTSFVRNQGGFKQVSVITANGTWTIPTGITKAKFTVIGGGAGGGGAASNAGSGGGAGAVAIKWLTGLTPGNTITVTVGGVASATSIASGTQTISTVTAGAGTLGTTTVYSSAGSVAAGGAGGTASGGDINFSGGAGGQAISTSTTITGAISGAGGSTVGWGVGGTSVGAATSAGVAGNGYGAGGSGSINSTSPGVGVTGAIIIEY